MKYDAAQILGMIVMVLGVQGTIRKLLDHEYSGLLSWVPGGFGPTLAAYVLAALVGGAAVAWAHGRAKAAGRRG
ncbi:hypothetical protein ACFYVL_28430 [Streptomyces sp. NPDC004111]|uniref:hypothetical protein n=1 Tax=Streptomyces sp. NPDC004111 TaxID=3364690 RepID=UPI0036CC9B3A